MVSMYRKRSRSQSASYRRRAFRSDCSAPPLDVSVAKHYERAFIMRSRITSLFTREYVRISRGFFVRKRGGRSRASLASIFHRDRCLTLSISRLERCASIESRNRADADEEKFAVRVPRTAVITRVEIFDTKAVDDETTVGKNKAELRVFNKLVLSNAVVIKAGGKLN